MNSQIHASPTSLPIKKLQAHIGEDVAGKVKPPALIRN
jgi:hypothetical protein